MSQYIVEGGKRLEGVIRIGGSKNAVLPILAATLLTRSTTILHNCPNITDVHIMIEILKELGCKVKKENNTLIIDAIQANGYIVSPKLIKQMRSSIIFLGSILGRFNKVKIGYPGGCALGERPIDMHLDALNQMGANLREEAEKIISDNTKLHGAKIKLDFPSVGATENIMLAAVLADGITEIIGAAKEPEIVDLQGYLNSCGAKVSGAGTNRIVIEGVTKLYETEYTIMPDRIITGTYLSAAAITKGEVLLTHTKTEYLKAEIEVLKAMGCYIKEGSNEVFLKVDQKLKGIDIITDPYPGYPTDMQPQLMALLTVVEGKSEIIEKIFSGRFNQVSGLNKLGASIQLEDQKAIITPVKNLIGAEVDATDLRGGAALVIAGLVAEGKTVINKVEHIKRGYEDMVYDLRLIGANINERK